MINKFLLFLFLGLFVTACTTTPEQDQGPDVIDKTGSADMTDEGSGDAEAGSEAQAFGAEGDQATALQELENPESLLSVRIIYFDYDSSTVLAQFEEIVQAHAVFLQANPGLADADPVLPAGTSILLPDLPPPPEPDGAVVLWRTS